MSDATSLLLLTFLVFLLAALYSSVGHGGASGYLAVLSFFAVSPVEMASTALLLNLLVAAVGAYSYWKAKHFSLRLVWPFLLTSIPLAFIGGTLTISDKLYFLLLAAVLIVAAMRLSIVQNSKAGASQVKNPSLAVTLPVGGGIGLLSGIVGVGGGIFLSPIMVFLNWADPKKTAAASAVFIFVNSLAGLGGRFTREAVVVGDLFPLIFAAFLGGVIGSYYGANRFSGIHLRRLLAVVLLVAAGKLVLSSL